MGSGLLHECRWGSPASSQVVSGYSEGLVRQGLRSSLYVGVKSWYRCSIGVVLKQKLALAHRAQRQPDVRNKRAAGEA